MPVDPINMETLTSMLFADEHDRYATRTNKLHSGGTGNKNKGAQNAQAHIATETTTATGTKVDDTLALVTGTSFTGTKSKSSNNSGNKKKKSSSNGWINKKPENNSSKTFTASNTGNTDDTSQATVYIAVDGSIIAGDYDYDTGTKSDDSWYSSDDEYEDTSVFTVSTNPPVNTSTLKMISNSKHDLNLSKLWILDSGATRHLTLLKPVFEEDTLRKLSIPVNINGFNGTGATAREVGTVQLTPTLEVTNMIYTPGTRVSLISQSALIRDGLRMKCHMHEQNNTVHCITFYEFGGNYRNRDHNTFYLCHQGLWIYKTKHDLENITQDI
jgi:hypothetical protein